MTDEMLERMSSGEGLREAKRYFRCSLQLKTEGEEGTFSGYASAYAKDLQGDRISPGAFAQSIKDKRGQIPLFYNHDEGEWIGLSTSLAEDGKGLALAGKLFDNAAGKDAYALLKGAAALDYRVGMSIGFVADEFEWDPSANLRTINTIDLWEASLTPFPAQPKAFVNAVKSARTLEWYLRDVGRLSKSDAKRAVRAMSDLNLSSGGTPDGFPPVNDRQSRWLKALIAQSPWKDDHAG